MKDINYTISETIYRQNGEIIEIFYEYNEIKQEQIEDNMQIKQENRVRNYQASIKRHEYEYLAKKIPYQRNILSYDRFIFILRLFMMGTYHFNEEIYQAFHLLDQNSSNTIDLNELSTFLSVIHPNMTKEILFNSIHQLLENNNQQINFDQFKQMILKGIGRDIVCGYV